MSACGSFRDFSPCPSLLRVTYSYENSSVCAATFPDSELYPVFLRADICAARLRTGEVDPVSDRLTAPFRIAGGGKGGACLPAARRACPAGIGRTGKERRVHPAGTAPACRIRQTYQAGFPDSGQETEFYDALLSASLFPRCSPCQTGRRSSGGSASPENFRRVRGPAAAACGSADFCFWVFQGESFRACRFGPGALCTFSWRRTRFCVPGTPRVPDGCGAFFRIRAGDPSGGYFLRGCPGRLGRPAPRCKK